MHFRIHFPCTSPTLHNTHLKWYTEQPDDDIRKCQIRNIHVGNRAHLLGGGNHPYDQRVANDSQNTNAAIEDGEQCHNFRGCRIQSFYGKKSIRLDR